MRIGLWQKESAKGNIYLGGADKDNNIRYMVFKDTKTEGVRRLVKKPLDDNDAPLEDVATLTRFEKDGTPFFKGDGYAIFTNSFYEEGSNQPNFNLVIGE